MDKGQVADLSSPIPSGKGERLPNALMGVHAVAGTTKNIGDYIQAVATNQFMRTSTFIEREELKSYDGDRCKVILNGWFMRRTEEFPPSEKIVPLVTSFHITPAAIEGMLTEEGIAWLKRHAPIGCRDRATCRLLLQKGVPAYFSSCLTLTLGMSYHSKPQKSNILFVDPVIPHAELPLNKLLRSPGMWLNLLFRFLPSLVIGRKLKRNCDFIDDGAKGWVKAIVYASLFVKGYRSKFSVKTLMTADYASHRVKWSKVGIHCSDEEFMRIADETLKRYEKYPLVVTSRIHCALPCLAMGTPAIFVRDREGRVNGRMSLCTDSGRIEGLADYFNTRGFDKDWHLEADFPCEEPISASTHLPQDQTWRKDAERLARHCRMFASEGVRPSVEDGREG